MAKFFKILQAYWGYGAMVLAAASWVYTAGIKNERKNSEAIQVKKQIQDVDSRIQSVIDFQKRDSIYFYTYKAKEERTIDSLATVFMYGFNQLERLRISQDSLKAYFIRKAATKEDMQNIYNIWGRVEKKNPYLIPYEKIQQSLILSFRR